MKLIFEKLIASPDEGLAVKVLRATGFNCPWHVHAEYELSLVLASNGWRMVGDHYAPLEPGDLVLVGPNLPHIYQNDDPMPGTRAAVHCVIVQFEERLLAPWLSSSAMLPVKRLLERSRLGLQFTGRTRQAAAEKMRELPKHTGLRRVITFLEVLELLAGSRQCRSLASPGFAPQVSRADHDRVNVVCDYIQQRVGQPLRIAEVARLVHMSEGAFSRFFRARLGRTFPAFLNQLRIGRACRLLAETDLPVTEVAAICGYGNLSNFNRQFFRAKRLAPRSFRQQLRADPHAL